MPSEIRLNPNSTTAEANAGSNSYAALLSTPNTNNINNNSINNNNNNNNNVVNNNVSVDSNSNNIPVSCYCYIVDLSDVFLIFFQTFLFFFLLDF
jgi:hypothetical protein